MGTDTENADQQILSSIGSRGTSAQKAFRPVAKKIKMTQYPTLEKSTLSFLKGPNNKLFGAKNQYKLFES